MKLRLIISKDKSEHIVYCYALWVKTDGSLMYSDDKGCHRISASELLDVRAV